MTPVVYMAAGQDGEPGNGCYSRERGEMEVTSVSAQISMWGSNPWGSNPWGGLWSSRSDHSALKSADTAFSSHPENDLIYS